MSAKRESRRTTVFSAAGIATAAVELVGHGGREFRPNTTEWP